MTTGAAWGNFPLNFSYFYALSARAAQKQVAVEQRCCHTVLTVIPVRVNRPEPVTATKWIGNGAKHSPLQKISTFQEDAETDLNFPL